ncbi:hypothetical protein Pelo_13223 [Pelomyxa schiedti]|nr:hypothetical protein Pelo_13223 [Pelomyxa schiedti]
MVTQDTSPFVILYRGEYEKVVFYVFFWEGVADAISFSFFGLFMFLAPWHFIELQSFSSNLSDLRKQVIKHGLEGLVDWLVIFIVVLLIVPSGYRLPGLLRDVKQKHSSPTRWMSALRVIELLFMDIAACLCLVFLVLTVYGFATLDLKSKTLSAQLSWAILNPSDQPSVQLALMEQCILVLSLIPWVLLLPLTLHRSIVVIYNALHTNCKFKTQVQVQLCETALDLCCLPCLIVMCFLTITLWRFPSLFLWDSPLLHCKGSRSQVMKHTMKCFLYFCVDIPALVAVIFLGCVRYHGMSVLLAEWLQFIQASSHTQMQADKDENPVPHKTVTWHYLVLVHIARWSIQFPLCVLVVASLWRFPSLLCNLSKCETSLERMREALKADKLTVLDIAAFFLTFLILATLVGVVFLWNQIRKQDFPTAYHSIVWEAAKEEFNFFLSCFENLPTFLLYSLCTIVNAIFFWRFAGFLKHLVKGTRQETVKTLIILYFLRNLRDVFIFLSFMVILLFGFWRWPTFITMCKVALSTPNERIFFHSETVEQCTFHLLSILILDYFVILQAPVILLSVHCFCFLKVSYCVWHGNTVAVHPLSGDKKDYPVSSPDYHSLVQREFLHAVRDIPQIPLVFLKIVAIPTLPIFFFVGYRLGKKLSRIQEEQPEPQNKQDRLPVTHTFLFNLVSILWEETARNMHAYKVHQILILNLVMASLCAMNDIAVVIATLNALFIYLITLGSPIWYKWAQRNNWLRLGEGRGRVLVVVLDITCAVFQVLLIPTFMCMQWSLFVLPFTIFLAVETESDTFMERVFSLPWYAWIVQLVWITEMLGAWEITVSFTHKYPSMFNPTAAYLWLFRTCETIINHYCLSVILSIKQALSNKSASGLLLFGTVLIVSTFLPPAIVLVLCLNKGLWYALLFIPCGCQFIWLVYVAVFQLHNRNPMWPHFTLMLTFPELSNPIIHVCALTSPCKLVEFNEAALFLEGVEFWRFVKFKMIHDMGLFVGILRYVSIRWKYLPYRIVPCYSITRAAVCHSVDFQFSNTFPYKKFGTLTDLGEYNPPVLLRLEYGKFWGTIWRASGVMLSIEVTARDIFDLFEGSVLALDINGQIMSYPFLNPAFVQPSVPQKEAATSQDSIASDQPPTLPLDCQAPAPKHIHHHKHRRRRKYRAHKQSHRPTVNDVEHVKSVGTAEAGNTHNKNEVEDVKYNDKEIREDAVMVSTNQTATNSDIPSGNLSCYNIPPFKIPNLEDLPKTYVYAPEVPAGGHRPLHQVIEMKNAPVLLDSRHHHHEKMTAFGKQFAEKLTAVMQATGVPRERATVVLLACDCDVHLATQLLQEPSEPVVPINPWEDEL